MTRALPRAELALRAYRFRFSHSLFAEAMRSTTTDPARSDDAPGPARPSRSTCAWVRPITVFIIYIAFHLSAITGTIAY